ncbi:MAG: hemin receptor [Burkholderiales bacterium]|nr:hemin receptor [Anaerolineae bacterium]
MTLSTHQIDLIQSSFTSAIVASDEVAATFYARLFELDPSLRHLFKGDMYAQGIKLMQLLGVLVAGLYELESHLVPAIEGLGQRHVHYGVKPEDYGTVGQALLWALDETLGSEFTPEVRDAWTEVYGIVVQVITERVYGAQKPI